MAKGFNTEAQGRNTEDREKFELGRLWLRCEGGRIAVRLAAKPPPKVSHIWMGSLAWRDTYQQGLYCEWGKREREQGMSSSGWRASIWNSILLPLCGIERMRTRWMEEVAGPNLGTASRRWNHVRSTE